MNKEIDDYEGVEMFVAVTWPDVQHLMDHPDFQKRCHLINDAAGIEEYGSSAYFVPVEIIEEEKETEKRLIQSVEPFVEKEKEIWVCSNCGSAEVEAQTWVDLNSNEPLEDVDPNSAESYWCRACEQYHVPIEKDNFKIVGGQNG